MGYSEILILLLVYSGLIAFFLIPFQSGRSLIIQQQGQINFMAAFKKSLISMIFHKKAILAIILLTFALFSIWSGYEGAEYHFNAHSCYSAISTNFNASYTMYVVFVYTVVLFLLIAFVRTLKIVRKSRD